MAYRGLPDFINDLEKRGQLRRITEFADPVLEITEITDRIVKAKGPALLFENNGTRFPLLINAFGSEERTSLAIGQESLEKASSEIEKIFKLVQTPSGSIAEKIRAIPELIRMARILPSKSRRRGRCQEIVKNNPDLSEFPVLKCWPHDGGPFITLPVVHTRHPETGSTNAGMYRMQVIGRNTTAMHWQLHKTGASHFEAWKKAGRRMPVSVVLGGDPVYTYAATAPLPENIDEYILAGFLRKKSVRMVRCITNDIWVPADADIVLEGYVDPAEEPFWEGPFGDHTGFYSLADWYPKFHITCITHATDAVYPATIVGIPPQEDEFLAVATEKIFLPPIKLALAPEITDLHMPAAGVAHNLAVVKIRKSFPGHGNKVINSLLGAGQMMFTKYLIVVSGDVDIRDYRSLAISVAENVRLTDDLIFMKGPLDVLDHSSDSFAFGGKLGIDATEKRSEERSLKSNQVKGTSTTLKQGILDSLIEKGLISGYSIPFDTLPVIIISVNQQSKDYSRRELLNALGSDQVSEAGSFILIVDHTVEISDYFTVAWQMLGNSDPVRDHHFIAGSSLIIDGTMKVYRDGGFSRRWPEVVCSDENTIAAVDRKWESLRLGDPLISPSVKYSKLRRGDSEEVVL